ncbi:MAG TPA: penicillin-binding transpeptidase domain-containing protein [Mycobacteriales bacterium]|nr:penicillin-binding transpeptidase domain-containing protein [Mycobacteriales bacterium]
MRRPTLVLSGLLALVLAAVAVWQVPRLFGDDDGDARAARAFAAAWTGGTLADLPWDPAGGPDPAGQVAALTAGLLPDAADRPAAVSVVAVRGEGDTATADLDVRWEVGAPWRYRTQLPLRRSGDTWRPVLSPAVVQPALTPGRVLRTRVVQAPRAAVTDRTGAPIVTARPVVDVGIQPSRAPDLTGSTRQVAALTGVDAAGLLTRAQAARPDAFVDVVTLRREAYDAVRDRLRPVPGVVLREGVRQLAPTTAFARALLGSVGPATAEAVSRSDGRVRAGQEVGLSGLQQRFDAQLGGTAGLTVEAVDAATGANAQSLLSTPPAPGTPLQLTLDPRVQQAADAALAARTPAGKVGALVVLQPSTGDVLAVANTGPDGPGVDRALTGRYPPGSTFKIASTLALLRQGLTPDEVVPCPAQATVSGKVFVNAEAGQLGPVPFRTDFAQSCNTAFVGSARRVSGAQLQAAARDLGYGTYDLGVGAFGADVPAADDPVEHAASLLGQGRVLASPLAVAASAATVAAGALHPPRVLATGTAPAPGPGLPQAGVLQELTRLVVTSGTGTALSAVPGGPVGGKTGTAEFGTEVPPRTHAWFAGYQGDLAFAVLVEDGGFGGAVAAPIAAALLTGLQ